MEIKRGSLIAVFLFIVLFFFSLKYDLLLSNLISSNRIFLITELLLGMAFVSSEIILFFFLTSLFLWRERKRRWILPLWLCLASSAILSFLLKIAVQRQRPFEYGVNALPALISENFSTWNFSFPSFQTMMVFSAVPVLSKEFPRFKYVWIVFASLIAFSRFYFGIHFFSDILAGAAIGYLIGLFIIKKEEDSQFGKKFWDWIAR